MRFLIAIFFSFALFLNFPSSSFAGTIAIPCLNDSGSVVNAQPADVCKALLPKCTNLKTTLVNQMKNMLSWKIYGYYYLNKNIALDKSSVDGIPDGPTLPYPVCSVVGHRISGGEKGEIDQQSVGGKLSCGDYPILQNTDFWSFQYRTKIKYVGNNGNKWFSYVLGAYPWELRRNAYDVIKELKDDLSNINDVVKSQTIAQGIQDTLDQMIAPTKALSADVKAICDQPPEKSILTSCTTPGALSITDPVQKLCSFAKVQQMVNAVALPNLLVYEVWDRTKKMHDEKFSKLFLGSSDTDFGKLITFCANTQYAWFGFAMRKSYSCNASCLTDGQDWYTWADWHSSKEFNNNQPGRTCHKDIHINISDKTPHEGTGLDYSTSNGFAGIVEAIIRNDVCQQDGNKNTGSSICDIVDIKDKPEGVK